MPNLKVKDKLIQELLGKVRSTSRHLYAFRFLEGFLGIFWLILLVVFVFVGSRFGNSLTLPVLVIPFTLSLLSFGHVWRRNSSDGMYRDLKKLLVKGNLSQMDRRYAREAIHQYQTYSKPPFVRGSATNTLAIAFLLLTLALSISLIAFL